MPFQADIPSGEPVFIDLPRYFKSNRGQCDIVLRLKKILYGQAKAPRLWYEKLLNGLLAHVFVTNKVNPCLFMSKTVICVVYVDDCLFWERSKYDIDNVMIYLKENGPVTFGNTQRENQCLSSWALISRHWMMVYFSSIKLS